MDGCSFIFDLQWLRVASGERALLYMNQLPVWKQKQKTKNKLTYKTTQVHSILLRYSFCLEQGEKQTEMVGRKIYFSNKILKRTLRIDYLTLYILRFNQVMSVGGKNTTELLKERCYQSDFFINSGNFETSSADTCLLLKLVHFPSTSQSF